MWRIFKNPDSLLTRLWKGLYYSHGDFWNAGRGSQPSWGWQSIIMARDSVAPQVMHRIGNGKNTSIRTDRWLKSGPIGGTTSSHEPEKVLELINPATGTWNEPLLSSMFDDRRVQEILATPIGLPNEDDKLVWMPTNTGEYSVKSGYSMFRKVSVIAQDKQATSSYQARPDLWKNLWQSSIPPRIKNFLWNACNNALATMENLHHRNIVPSPLCPLCKQEVETLEHTFLLCPWTANRGFYGAFGRKEIDSSSISKIRSHNQQSPEQQRSQKSALNGEKKSKQNPENLSESWLPPPPGTICINIDAAYEPDPESNTAPTERGELPRHRAAIACVCRDYRGLVVDGFAKPVAAASALQAEAIAMNETLTFIESRSFLSPQVQSDCLSLVHALKTSTELTWELHPIVSRAQAKLDHLPGLSLAHCNRSTNRTADWIAKACRNNSLPSNWIFNPPLLYSIYYVMML
ncbi:uncharacterized protein [Rutidosis leptorrhynchoides]|uniref:uncharacterized protein n=1 Tax=Rutidosis leptorrhynchoides TaxID=125765 RepID=UPI003A990936